MTFSTVNDGYSNTTVKTLNDMNSDMPLPSSKSKDGFEINPIGLFAISFGILLVVALAVGLFYRYRTKKQESTVQTQKDEMLARFEAVANDPNADERVRLEALKEIAELKLMQKSVNGGYAYLNRT